MPWPPRLLLRTALPAALAAMTAAGTPGMSATPGPSPTPPRGTACADALRALETRWGGTGAWRRLAPYPVPREASPTHSAGVWLERWTLQDGTVMLRRVSAHETVAAQVEPSSCGVTLSTARRTYDSAAVAASFTDETLRALLRQGPRGMIYVWSPGMPLSLKGLAEARAAARTLGAAFTAVVADARDDDPALRRVDPAHARAMESVELVYRDATVHYPAVVLYQDGRMMDGVIPGYKHRDAYVALARELLRDADGKPSPHASASASASVSPVSRATGAAGASAAPALWVDHRARVTTRSSVPLPREIGFFFKPVAGTSLVAYTSPDDRAYLFDLGTRRERRIPGTVDPVPTPDGRFLTRPGLLVHAIPALARGETDTIFTDAELPDEYQTASVLQETRGVVRYRVVTGWHEHARFRDYDVAIGPGERARWRPAGQAFVPCGKRALALPINAKSGREFGAFDVRRGTNGIIEVTEGGTCQDRLDLGFASGKLAFSYDGRLVAFSTSRINVDTAGALFKPSESFYSDALVLERASGRIVSLTRNRPLRARGFPEFLPDGTIMLLDQHTAGNPTGYLRVVDMK